MRLYLHTGMAKTGSTSIQKMLYRNADLLNKNGFLYPTFEGRSSQNILSIFFSQDNIPRGIVEKGFGSREAAKREGQRQFDLFLDAVQRSTAHTCLISGEYFFGLKGDSASLRFQQCLAPIFDEVIVLTYLRDPASYFLSKLQQRLRASYSIAPLKAETYDSVDSYEELFETQVAEFSPRTLIGGDVAKDYLSRVGIDFLQPTTRKNQSLSAEGMQLMKEHRENRFHGQNNRQMDASRPYLKAIKKAEAKGIYTKPVLHSKIEAWLRRPTPALERIKAKYGIDFIDSSGTISSLDAQGLENRNDLYEFVRIDDPKKMELEAQVLSELNAESSRNRSSN